MNLRRKSKDLVGRWGFRMKAEKVSFVDRLKNQIAELQAQVVKLTAQVDAAKADANKAGDYAPLEDNALTLAVYSAPEGWEPEAIRLVDGRVCEYVFDKALDVLCVTVPRTVAARLLDCQVGPQYRIVGPTTLRDFAAVVVRGMSKETIVFPRYSVRKVAGKNVFAQVEEV